LSSRLFDFQKTGKDTDMKRLLALFTFAIVFSLLLGNLSVANAQKAPKDSKVKMCNTCHKEGKTKPEEFKAWLYTTHSKTGEAVKTDAAKEIAAKINIEELSEDAACFECHTNKFDEELTFKVTEINCESCHDTKSKVHEIKDKLPHPQTVTKK
jgi:cytochrome c553